MIVASNNKGKLREIKEIFSDIELKSLKEANFSKKALFIFASLCKAFLPSEDIS